MRLDLSDLPCYSCHVAVQVRAAAKGHVRSMAPLLSGSVLMSSAPVTYHQKPNRHLRLRAMFVSQGLTDTGTVRTSGHSCCQISWSYHSWDML